jgi:hypothetical protein
MPLSLQFLKILTTKKEKGKKSFSSTPKSFIFQLLRLKKKKQKSQKIKPSHYDRKKENKPSFS